MFESHGSSSAMPSASFLQQVQSALEHLHDFPSLQNHPLARMLQPVAERSREPAGQLLRRRLIEAIESLSPDPKIFFQAAQARPFNVLQMHYMDGMSIQEVATELCISSRQVYRDLHHGVERVATLLWTQLTAEAEDQSGPGVALQAAINRASTHAISIDISPLLDHARRAVERLAQARGVVCEYSAPDGEVPVFTDSAMAQQLLVSILSRAVQAAQPGRLSVVLVSSDEGAQLSVQYTVESNLGAGESPAPVIQQLADQLNWSVIERDEAGGGRTVQVRMRMSGPTLLVIDDDEGLTQLMERYLSTQACRLVQVASGAEGLRLAKQLAPDAIILDVMMPGIDGWEVLQTLHTDPATSNIPVITCSVVNDPLLAMSLGATLYLPKPLSRDDLIAALRQLGLI